MTRFYVIKLPQKKKQNKLRHHSLETYKFKELDSLLAHYIEYQTNAVQTVAYIIIKSLAFV